jgi:hypothetical protein
MLAVEYKPETRQRPLQFRAGDLEVFQVRHNLRNL